MQETYKGWAAGFRRFRAILRARRIRRNSKYYFSNAVCNCAGVSANNNRLAFAVHHVGPFGGPLVKLIPRPDVVKIDNTMKCVIIRDGSIYELTSFK